MLFFVDCDLWVHQKYKGKRQSTVVRHAEVKYAVRRMRRQLGRGTTKENRKKTGQECLVRTVPHGRKRGKALPLVLPEPRRPNLERVGNRWHRKRKVKDQNKSESMITH